MVCCNMFFTRKGRYNKNMTFELPMLSEIEANFPDEVRKTFQPNVVHRFGFTSRDALGLRLFGPNVGYGSKQFVYYYSEVFDTNQKGVLYGRKVVDERLRQIFPPIIIPHAVFQQCPWPVFSTRLDKKGHLLLSHWDNENSDVQKFRIYKRVDNDIYEWNKSTILHNQKMFIDWLQHRLQTGNIDVKKYVNILNDIFKDHKEINYFLDYNPSQILLDLCTKNVPNPDVKIKLIHMYLKVAYTSEMVRIYEEAGWKKLYAKDACKALKEKWSETKEFFLKTE